MLLMIDNYDSFTYNLVQYLAELGAEVKTVRNDEIDIAACAALKPSHIVISPGPCTPKEAGLSSAVIHHFKDNTPILGVCLGHQTLAAYFGAQIQRAPRPMHGKCSQIKVSKHFLFNGLPQTFNVTRYHSSPRAPGTPSHPRASIAHTADDEQVNMASAHHQLPLLGVQFHPEAILTEHGHH
jgi:anthranilate synthase/aminodeoxychorismate synthase-like glutamine amidotransferase